MVVVACMAVGHGVWKTSEPLSDLDQLLNIAKHDPFVSAKWVVSVCSAQQRLVYTMSCPMAFPRGAGGVVRRPEKAGHSSAQHETLT